MSRHMLLLLLSAKALYQYHTFREFHFWICGYEACIGLQIAEFKIRIREISIYGRDSVL